MTNEKLYETLGDINGDYVREARDYRKTKKTAWLKLGAAVACLCLVIIGVLAVPGLQKGHGGTVPQRGGTPGTEGIRPEDNSETTQPGRINSFVVNEVEGVMGADMDVQLSNYDNLSAAEWKTVLQDFENAMGLRYDAFMARISDIFANKSFYSVDVPADAARTEYIPHDYVFEYQTENGGEAAIAICSVGEPVRDCLIICEDPKQSEINGVTVFIYGYQDNFMVQFSHENLNYDIETKGVALEELEALLEGIIN